MVTFYCTRCGVRMEIEPDSAGREVRCVRCAALVRTPSASFAEGDAAEEIPFAQIVAGGNEAEESAHDSADTQPLTYAPAWPERHEHSLLVEQAADRLRRVEAAGDREAEAMINCPYCGTTIARFIRKCPSCRHALWGI